MLAKKLSRFTAVTTAFVLLTAVTSEAQKRQRVTEETLVPEEFFVEKQKTRFDYKAGVEVAYFKTEAGHQWRLNELSAQFEPTPTPSPTPTPTPADGEPLVEETPEPEPTPTPEATPPPLEATADEVLYLAEVALVRPTVVTVIFTESAAAAKTMVDEFLAEKKLNEEPEILEDGKTKPKNLVVFKLEKDAKIRKSAIVYNREYNLGTKGGGMRRASSVVAAKRNVFIRVDARKGLRDGAFDSRESTLEKRARKVAQYVLRKL